MEKEILKTIFGVTEIKDKRLYNVVCAIYNGTDVYGNEVRGRLNFNQSWRTGISRTLLHKLCMRELGLSSKLVRYRIVFYKACKELARGVKTLDAVKRFCRYESMDNFKTFFKKQCGMTPLQYRNKFNQEIK